MGLIRYKRRMGRGLLGLFGQSSFLPYRKVFRISHMVKSNYRAAVGKYVAAAARRRRRILQAGFFFYVQRKYVVMGDDRSCVHGRVRVYGFCRGLLSSMGRLWMADRSSASGIHAARRLTVTSMSRFPWLSNILLSKTPLQKPKHPHPPMHATPTFSIPLIKRVC